MEEFDPTQGQGDMKMREDGSEKEFGINIAVFRQQSDGLKV